MAIGIKASTCDCVCAVTRNMYETFITNNFFSLPVSWSIGNAFVSGAGGLKFKSRANKIGHIVANGSSSLRQLFERSRVAASTATQRDGPHQLFTLRRNTANIMKDLIWFGFFSF